MRGPIHLSELAPVIEIVCDQCQRRGKYHRDRLLARIGDEVAPQVLVIIAKERGCKVALLGASPEC